LQLVPIGVPGELYIGGDGLARGYLNRPELTTARFVPHPFSDIPGDRLYKTGDLAHYCPNGTIEHLGRLDFQVKIRGYRIELGEIEAVLNQHPAVRQTVVVARDDMQGDKRLVAYLVMKKGLNATVEDLRHHVTKQVPAYMVPSVLMILEAMPLTPNGKVDRGAFPVPESSRYSSKDSFAVPTLPLHSQLVQIWEELLDARPIGTRDNFFDLGGHSLLAARLVNRIEQDWGKKIPLNTLLADATIERLAEVIMQPEDESLVTSTRENSFEGKTGFSRTKKGLLERVAGVMNRRAARVSE
jgi:aspartate racemase